MTRSDRMLATAAMASVLLHGIALIATSQFDLSLARDADRPTPPIEARIVMRAPAPASHAKPALIPPALIPSALIPNVAKSPRAPAQQRTAPKPVAAASRWIARPDVLGAVPPMPDGGISEPVAQAAPDQATGAATVASMESAPDQDNGVAGARDGAEGGAGDVPEYPVHRARLVYDLYYGGGQAGILTHTWSTDGRVYHAESIAEGVGLVKLFYSGRFVQRSTGRIGPAGLIPIEYTLNRGSAARSETARFDWQGSKLSLAWKDQRRVIDLPAGTQDALSIVHQAYYMGPTASAAPLGVASSRKLGHYIYEIVGEDLIETPLGILRTMHLRRADDDGMRLDIWLDLDRSLLPARIFGVDRRGTEFEQMIREASVGG